MKKNYTCLTLLLIVFLLGSTQFVSAQSLIAHYKLDETIDTTAFDASGNGLDVPLNGITDANWVDGSLLLNGTQYGQISPPKSDAFKVKSLTISAMIKHDTVMNDWGDWICASGDNWGLYLNGDEGLTFYIHHSSGWDGVVDNNIALYLEGDWHHVVATFDGETREAKIYRDGELVGESILPGNIDYSVEDNFNIGAMTEGRQWKGNLKEIRIYDGVFPEGLIASYDFNAGTGTTVTDASTKMLDGTINGDPMWVMGKSGSAVEFNSSNMTLPADTAFVQNEFTISAWMKLTEDLGVEWYPVFTHDFGGTDEYGLLIGDGGYVVLHAPGLGLGAVTSWNNNEVVKGTWAHVAVTVDAEGNGKVYVNGVETASATGGHALADPSVESNYVAGVQGHPERDFPGVIIDDLQIYDTALSASEIFDKIVNSKSGAFAHWTFEQKGTTVDLGTDTVFIQLGEGPESIDTIVSVTEVADITGNGFELSFPHLADSSWVNDTVIGNSIELNGFNQFGRVDSAASTNLMVEEFTVSTYIKIEENALAEQGWARIAGFSDAWGFNVDNGFVGMWSNHGTGWHGSYANKLPIDDGEWHYIAMTHSQTAGNVFYVDGQVALEQDWSAQEGNQIVYGGERPFAVGTSISDWGETYLVYHNALPGNLNNLKVYNRVLSKEELNSAGSGLVAHYDYEEVSGKTVPDLTVNLLDGWISDTDSSSVVDGQHSESAIALTNTHIRLPDDIAFSQSTFTIASWMKLTVDPRVKAEWYPVFTNDFGGNNEIGLLIGDGGYVVLHAPGVGLEAVTTWNNDEVAVDIWAHVAVTVDAAGVGIVYVDGIETARATGGHQLTPKVSASYIGGAQDPVRDFSGVILDDTRFYSVALTAEEIFVLASESFKLDIAVEGNGTVSPAGGNYTSGTAVELTATPGDGYIFAGWSGDITSTDNPVTVTMDSDKSVTATFEVEKFVLTVTIAGNGTVTPGSGEYSGSTMLTATADEGWIFDSWSGDLTGTENPTFIEMSQARAVTATFIEDVTSVNESAVNGNSLSNYPNPFTNRTTINYSINEASAINITVYSALGKVVEVLVNENKPAGSHSIEWDGHNLPAGIYLYKLQSDSHSVVNRMLLNK